MNFNGSDKRGCPDNVIRTERSDVGNNVVERAAKADACRAEQNDHKIGGGNAVKGVFCRLILKQINGGCNNGDIQKLVRYFGNALHDEPDGLQIHDPDPDRADNDPNNNRTEQHRETGNRFEIFKITCPQHAAERQSDRAGRDHLGQGAECNIQRFPVAHCGAENEEYIQADHKL